MEWKSKVAELFGCKYPILQGAMQGLGNWKFAAAVAEAGGHGMLTASVSRTPERLREQIKKIRDTTDGSFGVNLSIGVCPRIEEMLEVCIEERVQVETAVYKPDSLAPRIKEGGVKWMHKTATVKHALHAENLGADAVCVVGLEGIGFKNVEQLTTMLTTIEAKRKLKVPFIAAGGIGDARGFLGTLGLGADGILMGTAFLTTEECPLSDSVKQKIVKASVNNPYLLKRALHPPDPKDVEEVLKLRDELPLEKWLPIYESVHLKEPDWREKIKHSKLGEDPTEDYEEMTSRPAVDPDAKELGPAASRIVSLAVGVIDRVTTVKEFIDGIIQGAEELLDGYQFVRKG